MVNEHDEDDGVTVIEIGRLEDGRPCPHCLLMPVVNRLCEEDSPYEVRDIITALIEVSGELLATTLKDDHLDKLGETVRYFSENLVIAADLALQHRIERENAGDNVKEPTTTEVGHA